MVAAKLSVKIQKVVHLKWVIFTVYDLWFNKLEKNTHTLLVTYF